MLPKSFVTAGILMLGNPAVSEIIDSGPAGLAEPESTVTFAELTFPDDTPISTEFSSLGVTFSPSLYYRIASSWEAQGINRVNLRSGNLAGDPPINTFSIHFTEARSSVAFASIASPVTPATITARFGGVDVESLTTEINLDNSSWYGFTEIVLDEIEIAYTEVTRLRIDNIQLGPRANVDGPGFDVAASGDSLVLTWESQSGKLYTLRSETDPSAAEPKDWPVFDGKMDLPATPPENTLTISRPADPFRLFVIEEFNAPPVEIFADDFESGQGSWTTGPAEVTANFWELGTPSLVGPNGARSGINCFGTDLDGTYADDAVVWLRSPAIDLTTAGGATLNLFQFKDIEPSFDRGTINLLDAADDSLLVELQTDIDGLSPDWEQFSKKLPAEALGKVIKIEFVFTPDNFNTNPQAGWYIDDVVLTVP